MSDNFLRIPVDTGLITRKKELNRCSLYESVSAMVHLIATTQFGENKHDRTCGNELWEYDFQNIVNIQAFREELARSIRDSVYRHEKRLSDIAVNINFEQVVTTTLNRRVKQRIEITIKGTLVKTNEPFNLSEIFFMGPLSYY
jgi:predicted component of type VI protein secretion system